MYPLAYTINMTYFLEMNVYVNIQCLGL